jgi:hypothetical protein
VPRTKRAEPPGDDHGGRARAVIQTLSPGYFALVMASAIVSIATLNHPAYAISVFLMWVAGVAYTVLVVWRILAFRAAVAADLADPGLGFGYFTFIAGTDVLGSRLAADRHHRAAVVLLAVGWLAWLVPGYAVPWTAVLGHSRFPVGQYTNGI